MAGQGEDTPEQDKQEINGPDKKQKGWFRRFFNFVARKKPAEPDWLSRIAQNRIQPTISLPVDSLSADAAADDKAALYQACFMLSQSRTGNYLLQMAQEKGYTVIFGDEKADEHGFTTQGGINSRHKVVFLNTGLDAARMVVILGHEIAHIGQKEAPVFKFAEDVYRTDTAIKVTFAAEADARAHETQIALELKFGDPGGPADQYKTDTVFDALMETAPYQAIVGLFLAQNDPKTLSNHMVMAAVFEMFYDEPELREGYARHVLDRLEGKAAEMGTVFNFLSYRDDVKADKLCDAVRHLGQPYLKDVLQEIDMSGARYRGSTEQIRERAAAFYERFQKTHKKAGRAAAKMPQYVPDPRKIELVTTQAPDTAGKKSGIANHK